MKSVIPVMIVVLVLALVGGCGDATGGAFEAQNSGRGPALDGCGQVPSVWMQIYTGDYNYAPDDG